MKYDFKTSCKATLSLNVHYKFKCIKSKLAVCILNKLHLLLSHTSLRAKFILTTKSKRINTKQSETKRSKAKPSNIIESETSSYLTRLQQTENHPELPENKTNQDIQDAE